MPGPAPFAVGGDFPAQLLERAVQTTGVSFTLSAATEPDQPLVWVNPAFTRTTGYTYDEAVGRNCRFLQGSGTDPHSIAMMRAALLARRPVALTLLNYRKDGSSFWNAVTIDPVTSDDGTVTHFVGMQLDVTTEVLANAARERALAAEHAAVSRAELAQARLALLAEASRQLGLSPDVDVSLTNLLSAIVPTLADWAVIHRPDPASGAATPPLVRHKDGRHDLTRRYAELMPRLATEDAPLVALARDGRSWMAEEFDPVKATSWSAGQELADVRDELGAASAMFIALPGRNGIVGTMALNRSAESPRFTAEDFRLAVDLGRRAGLTIENGRLYQEEHRVAEILQRSLLPDLPAVEGLDIAARYRTAQDGAQVGGDFYDVLALPDDTIAIAVGDVVGHDINAAAAMGELRGMIRAVAWDAALDGDGTPSDVLRRVDRLVRGLRTVPMATVAYADLAPARPGQPRRLRYASAGHPSLLVRDPDGMARYLPASGDLLLGVQSSERTTETEVLVPGSTLIAYTDGLVERRGEDIDQGTEMLRLLVETAPNPSTADALGGFVMDWLGDSEDDTALLVVRLE